MLNVLIVDDSIVIRKSLKKFLTELGHSIAGEAKNGFEAIEQCKVLQPDLITMDITMPDMDGITATSTIKEFQEKVSILMVTSHGQEDMIVASLKAGAQGYLMKPLDRDKIAMAIGNIYPEYKPSEDYDDELLDE